MKDQNSVDNSETKQEKWDRGKTLFLESVHKPDHHLRSCAHNQKCFHELMEIRDLVIEGLSLARTQKEEFSSIIKSNDNKIDGLFANLKEFIK